MSMKRKIRKSAGKNISNRKHSGKNIALAGILVLGIVFGGYAIGNKYFHKSKPAVRYSYEYSHEDSVKKAREFFNNFPDVFDRAVSVRKYNVNDARYCLVHIRDFHGMADNDERFGFRIDKKEKYQLEKKINSVRALVQDDIYAILDRMIKQYGIRDGFCEGLSVEQENKMKAGFIRLKEIDLAIVKLYNENRIKIHATETEEMDLERKADALRYIVSKIAQEEGYEPQLSEEDMSKYLDCSENDVLKILANNSIPVKVFVYGGRHRFYNNIERWNRENPEQKYSMIEITPESYELRNNL